MLLKSFNKSKVATVSGGPRAINQLVVLKGISDDKTIRRINDQHVRCKHSVLHVVCRKARFPD